MSISMQMYLKPFKDAAAEGAAVELKLRLLAGSIPGLQQYAMENKLQDVENPVIIHFGSSLSAEEANTLRQCRILRNKVLHADFQQARDRLNELGVETSSGGAREVNMPVVTVEAITRKISGMKAGTEGVSVADTSSTASGTIYGWFLEAGAAGDFQKACDVFKNASVLIDRLAVIASA